MNTYRLRTMWLPLLVCQLCLFLRSEAQTPSTFCNMHSTFRPPVNSDITVTCGTEITNEVGTGLFSDFSNVQFVNISGTINSLDTSASIVTYRRQIIYMFSCRYPLQYLVNSSKVTVSGVSLAVRDNDGSFVSTLSMWLYSDTDYTQQLIVPENGINLKTRIFVGVKATSLTERFHVLLDRCYATTSPVPNNSTYYDLFVGCTRDRKTRVELNGASQNAHFSFEAFRFIEHKNMTISTFYLHCVTRLCEVSSCSSLLPNCSGSSRRKREAQGLWPTTRPQSPPDPSRPKWTTVRPYCTSGAPVPCTLWEPDMRLRSFETVKTDRQLHCSDTLAQLCTSLCFSSVMEFMSNQPCLTDHFCHHRGTRL
ncbi:zona pellucida-like domain-containing protein 1 [Salvelinus namaycush]|uniref:Zona pellucida-like domain-containing protein 1 n=1 Tax=Salvelinus namaycush TaxID=8040 RepID=A0A8U0TJH6_SALNM|nr:zona pellucida-like domain-containing protein 1 [Salvelinus namaycush]